ncbi:hypothetical protein GCM10008949_53070 [Deinococcus humi]|nr:hypothetical protein GCM10008949_53070 [Deinococcus humi]
MEGKSKRQQRKGGPGHMAGTWRGGWVQLAAGGRHTRARRGRGVDVCRWGEMLCATVKIINILLE